MQQLRRHWQWYALLIALILLVSPLTALATDTEPEQEVTSSDVPAQAPLPPFFDDLSLTRLYVRNHAFFPLEDEVINAATSVEEIMRALQQVDPYARYYSPEVFDIVMAYGESLVVGIGVFLDTDKNGQVFILGPVAGSAAELAGLRYGDIIVSVNGINTRNMTARELAEELRGDDGDLLVIRYERAGVIREETLSRNARPELSVSYWLLGDQADVAYLQIHRFTSHTGNQIEAALQSLTNRGMEALVLDLRNCLGGDFDSAITVSSQFTGPGPVAFYISRRGWESFGGYNEIDNFTMPLAVLINNYTASAAELVAANIQDVQAAPLIGEPTFGKGTFQTMITLPSGMGIVFTTGKFVTRGYQDIAAHGGLLPDILVRGAEAQMAAAIISIAEQRLTPRQVAFAAAAGDVLLIGGASYLAAEAALQQLGWELRESEGIIYGQRANRRLIIDTIEAELLIGSATLALREYDYTLYLPAVILRELGHTVEWDAATRSVIVSR